MANNPIIGDDEDGTFAWTPIDSLGISILEKFGKRNGLNFKKCKRKI